MKELDSASHAQRARLLKRLEAGPCTTTEVRHGDDILGVAPRIFELRHDYGYNILTLWDYGHNPGGGRHRVAKYVLLGRKGGDANEA